MLKRYNIKFHSLSRIALKDMYKKKHGDKN